MIRVSAQVVFILLGIVALSFISYDYTCGHTFEEVMNHEYCPICDSFNAADKVVITLFILILLVQLVLLGIAWIRTVAPSSSLLTVLFSLRAPPEAF